MVLAFLRRNKRKYAAFLVVTLGVYMTLIVIKLQLYTGDVKIRSSPPHIDDEDAQKNSSVEENKILSRNCTQAQVELKGNLKFEIKDIPPSLNHSELYGGQVKLGGSWSPKDCIPVKNVAILVPYRKRPQQLEVFLSHMHPIFQRQNLQYRIFVIEQSGKARFNKGAIYNIGFNKTLEYDDFDCYIFHDVDLLCENDRNYYGCPASPMHMSPAIDKFNYKLSYPTLMGGIQALTKEHYVKVNGYSNIFWGWGAEDDNFYTRILTEGLKVVRPDMAVARYKMNNIHHFRSDSWSQANVRLLRSRKSRQEVDGLDSIKRLNFTLVERLEPLFTLISIKLQEG